MRAKEINKKYTQELRRLGLVVEEKLQERDALIASLSEGAPRFQGQPIVGETAAAAIEAVDSLLKQAEDDFKNHRDNAPDLRRQYRIVDVENPSLILDEFIEDGGIAENIGKQRMQKRFITKFDIHELQPDGTWVSIFDRQAEQS